MPLETQQFAQATFAQGSTIRNNGYARYIPIQKDYTHEYKPYVLDSGLLHWLHSVVSKCYQPVVQALHNAGLFVSVVNPLLIYKYGNNSLRKSKTDKLDSVKKANYMIDHWIDLE